MARKSTKTVENTAQAIADALDTPLNLEWDTTAESLNTTIPELQERMASKLDDTVFTWANIPVEHQPVVDAVARELEGEASVRRFDVPTEPTAELPPIQEPEELPIIQDEAHAMVQAPESKDLAKNIAQDLNTTQRLEQEALDSRELLYAAETDNKAQLASAVKFHGWQVYRRLGAEIDAQAILEIAQEQMVSGDAATISRVDEFAARSGLKTCAEILAEIEAKKQSFFTQSQTRQQAWKTATSS